MTTSRFAALLCLGVLCLGVLGCAATPIRDPSALEHFEARVRSSDGWGLSLFRIPPDFPQCQDQGRRRPLSLVLKGSFLKWY